MNAPPIYVEILIRAPLEEVWEKTQDPALHTRWDLRFSGIEYLPRPSEGAPQRFSYTTRLGFGLNIRGFGETLGTRDQADGSRASSLRFWSDQTVSLIEEGSGYWRYIPTEDGVRFLTWYDYRVRFGALGRLVDRVLFRPLMGWATAWSFDRLRRWIEDGTRPEDSARQTLAHHGSRIALALCWTYQGIVPKLLVADSGELEILRDSQLVPGHERSVLVAAGIAEIGLGVLQVSPWNSPWPSRMTVAALPGLALGALKSKPGLFVRPFNPASLTVAMGALAVVALVTRPGVATARACLRKPRRNA